MRRVGKIHESVCGVADLDAAQAYWAEMGYRPIAEGRLEAADALARYGWESGVASRRLRHGESDDHGHLRLMQWDRPREGRIADWPTLSYGTRWAACICTDIVDLYDSFQEGIQAGEPYVLQPLSRSWAGPEDTTPGFMRRFVGFREFLVTGPEARQVVIARYRRERPGYGTIPADSPRGVSESTHHGLVVPIDADLSWYTDVIGFEISQLHDIVNREPGKDNELGVRPGEKVRYLRVGSDDVLIGILFLFSPYHVAPDARAFARPGARGMTLFTWRTHDLDALRRDSIAAGCTEVTEILPNEFGEPSLSLVSPDGVCWTILAE